MKVSPARAASIRRYRDTLKSPRREDTAARLAAFHAWVLRQGADLITLADVKTRLGITDARASDRLIELVKAGVLEKVAKGEWRLKGRTL